MKKILALILSLAMVFTLAACGGTNTDPSTEPSESTAEPTEAPTTESTEAPTEEPTEAPTEEPTETPTEPSAELSAAMGGIDGATYTNEMFGITFQLPESWAFATEEELAVLSGLAESIYDETIVGALLDTGATPIVMCAMNGFGTSSVNMNVQMLTDALVLSLDEYTSMTAEIMPSLLESSGMTVSNLETKQVSLAGEDRLGIAYDAEYGGVVMSQFIYYLAADGYLATVTITSPTAEEIDTIITNFAAIG